MVEFKYTDKNTKSVNLAEKIRRKNMYPTIPQMLYEKAKNSPNAALQYSKNSKGVFQPVTYAEFAESALNFGAGLVSLGANPGEHIGLIADNRKEWLVSSVGIMSAGCCDIPRGSEATVKDLSYILSFAGCRIIVVENSSSYGKIVECRSELKDLEHIVVIDKKNVDTEAAGVKVLSYDEVISLGKEYRNLNPGKIEETVKNGKEDDTATIIFTSGTTGTPKGVELLHKNFMCQIEGISETLNLKPGDKTLCVLPVWHVYEREMEYYYMANEIAMCYTKPVPSMILSDFKKINISFLACVPRIWDALYKQIEKNATEKSSCKKVLFKICIGAVTTRRWMIDIIMGRNLQFKKPLWLLTVLNKWLYIPCFFLLPLRAFGNFMFFAKARAVFGSSFKLGMSGGGALAPKLDRFFNSTGIRLVEGFGLTETAPIICIRNPKKPVMGTIGKAMPYNEIKVVDRFGVECAPGQMGVLYVRGDNVMKGYYKQPELTDSVIKEGWFNTGDLVVLSRKGDLMVKGRAKDTIVLRSGENVEPLPIENKLVESPYIAQAVIVGQDKNHLGALLIPKKENILEYAKSNNLNTESMSTLLKSGEIKNLINSELERLITPKNGFKPFEKVSSFCFLERQFEPGTELTAKGTVIRSKVNELYKWQIASMFSDSVIAQSLSGLSSLTGNIADNLKDLSSVKNVILEKIPGIKKESEK